MIEISFGKLILLALIALIVLGPEKLPGAARTAGALVRRLRNSWDSVRAEVERELEIEQIRRTAREAAARAEAMQSRVDAAVREVHEATAAIGTPPAAAREADGEPVAGTALPGHAAGEPRTGAAPPSDDDPDGDAPPPRDTRTGDLFADDPEHAPVKDHPHGLA